MDLGYIETLITVLSIGAGAFFSYHKFITKLIENAKQDSKNQINEIKTAVETQKIEFWKEINKLHEMSDKRDEEIKELIKDLKIDIKEDLNFIKDRMFPKE